MTVVASVLLAGGAALVLGGHRARRRERVRALAALLEAPGPDQAPVEHVSEEEGSFLEPGVALVHAALDRLALSQQIHASLLRARIPLRPGEFVLLALAGATIGAAAVGLLTGQPLVAGVAWFLLLWAAWGAVLSRGASRRKAFEQQLPEALSVIASSLEAGHTFMRAVEMMVEEAAPPLSEEFERVLSEVQLGDPTIDALDRMAERLSVSDLVWVVQAIRIQQTVGGKLAELLMTLAGFMRAREEIRREIAVLTAEGRLSARVLGMLPVGVFLVIRSMNPEYIEPLLHGSGLLALIGAGVSVLLGMVVIQRMARIDL